MNNQPNINISPDKSSVSVSWILDDSNLAITELSIILDNSLINYSSNTNWYFFNRINVPEKFRNNGIGSKLLQITCNIADEHKFNIYCPINPYGDLNILQLKNWYMKYGFINHTYNEVIRFHK